MPTPGGKQGSATAAMIQAVVALMLLIGLPFAVGEPETTRGLVADVAAALVLVGFLLEGSMRFLRNRRRPYPDSVMPPPPPGSRKPPTATRED
jgi:hypothetical protein